MPIQAKAAVADGKGSFTIETIEVHPPARDEVLVAIKASGICHTDHDSLNWGGHFVLGHEGAGVVEAIGEGVDHVSVGDKVLLNWAIPCKCCYQCEKGNQNICERYSQVTGKNPDDGLAHHGATTWNGTAISRSFNIGTLSSHTVVRKEAVIPMTVDIPMTSACIIGCGVMTGYGSVVNAAQLTPGSSAVVLGSGGVGLTSFRAPVSPVPKKSSPWTLTRNAWKWQRNLVPPTRSSRRATIPDCSRPRRKSKPSAAVAVPTTHSNVPASRHWVPPHLP